MRRFLPLLASLVLTLPLMAYETAPYTVVRSDGPQEIRDYPTLAVIETPMAAPGESDGSFMRLFRYIGGANERKEEISMTTPVFMDGSRMQFVLPSGFASAEAPAPSDPKVAVKRTLPKRVAVHRFSGGRNGKNEARAREALAAWMSAQGLEAAGEPVFAYYNGPFTPGFLRRNEVLVPLRGD
jgi:hypothetical protein